MAIDDFSEKSTEVYLIVPPPPLVRFLVAGKNSKKVPKNTFYCNFIPFFGKFPPKSTTTPLSKYPPPLFQIFGKNLHLPYN